MVGETKPEDTGVRFDGYLRELREFFESRNVGFGRPEDVIAFAARVSAPGPFQEEMGSMVRSILYCENERLGREELLELVVVAVGGSAVEPGMEGLQQAVRQLFVFLNAALRERGSRLPLGDSPEQTAQIEEPSETEVTAGDILRGEDSLPAAAQPVDTAPPAAVAVRRRSTAGDGMLFRAVTMAAERPVSPPATAEIATRPASRRLRNGWMVPAVAFAAAALVVLYLAWPALMRLFATRRTAAGMGAAAVSGPAQAGPAGAAACVAPIPARVSRVAVEQQSLMARSMLDQKMYSSALPQLQAIAQADPGYPGVYLDISNALLEMKLPEQARVAVDRQIGIMECLVKLPPAELEGYCREQFAPSAVAACRPQLAHLRQTSELQAAMVHLALGHQADPDDGMAASMRELTDGSPAADAPHTSTATSSKKAAGVRVLPAQVKAKPAPIERRSPPVTAARSPGASKSAEGDPSLRKGDGTDSVFGAYQKPQ